MLPGGPVSWLTKSPSTRRLTSCTSNNSPAPSVWAPSHRPSNFHDNNNNNNTDNGKRKFYATSPSKGSYHASPLSKPPYHHYRSSPESFSASPVLSSYQHQNKPSLASPSSPPTSSSQSHNQLTLTFPSSLLTQYSTLTFPSSLLKQYSTLTFPSSPLKKHSTLKFHSSLCVSPTSSLFPPRASTQHPPSQPPPATEQPLGFRSLRMLGATVHLPLGNALPDGLTPGIPMVGASGTSGTGLDPRWGPLPLQHAAHALLHYQPMHTSAAFRRAAGLDSSGGGEDTTMLTNPSTSSNTTSNTNPSTNSGSSSSSPSTTNRSSISSIEEQQVEKEGGGEGGSRGVEDELIVGEGEEEGEEGLMSSVAVPAAQAAAAAATSPGGATEPGIPQSGLVVPAPLGAREGQRGGAGEAGGEGRVVVVGGEVGAGPVRRKKAAVLVVMFQGEHGELRVWLTKRSGRLSSHSGEVALPGGKKDETDVDDADTALREAEEEIGLPRSSVRVVTHLEPFLSKHLLTVTPVVAVMPNPRAYQPLPNEDEVETVFSVPLSAFLEIDKHRHEDHEWLGHPYRVHFFSYTADRTSSHLLHSDNSVQSQEFKICGLTAAILVRVSCVVFGRSAPFGEFHPDAPNYATVLADLTKRRYLEIP